MKRFVSMLSAVVFASLLFCLPAFATTETTIYTDTTEEFESATEYVARLVQSQAVSAPVSDLASVSPVASSGSSGSFIPSLSVEGKTYAYNSALQIWLDEVVYGQNVAYEFNTRSDGINQTDVALSQLNHKNVKFVLSGFSNDCTYTGVAYFQLSVKRASSASTNFNAVADYYFYDPTNLSHSSQAIGRTLLTDFLVSSISCKDGSGQDLPVYYSRILSSSGTTYTYTFYVVLQDYYVGPSNGVVSVDNVVVNVDFIMGGQLRYILNGAYFPLSYFALVQNSCNVLTRSFSGSVQSGRHSFITDALSSGASSQNATNESLAYAQMNQNSAIAESRNQLSESQHDDLVNGYNNSSGASAMESGASNVESGVASEGSALESAGASAGDFDYDSVDLGSLATAFSLISGWFTSLVTALGSWNMLIMISLTMIVALFAVGYFRNK